MRNKLLLVSIAIIVMLAASCAAIRKLEEAADKVSVNATKVDEAITKLGSALTSVLGDKALPVLEELAKLREAFKQADKNKDGSVSGMELTGLLALLWAAVQSILTRLGLNKTQNAIGEQDAKRSEGTRRALEGIAELRERLAAVAATVPTAVLADKLPHSGSGPRTS